MILPSGDVKVLDFGLAKFAASSEQRLMNPVSRPTDPGLIFGTAEFMSPEQALGREVDHRSDLFSLGVILYELLTGALPFKGETRMELFWSILNTQPAPVSDLNASVSPELSALVSRLLEKDVRGRPPTAARVLEELEEMRPRQAEDRQEPRDPAALAGENRRLGARNRGRTRDGPGAATARLWVDETRDEFAQL